MKPCIRRIHFSHSLFLPSGHNEIPAAKLLVQSSVFCFVVFGSFFSSEQKVLSLQRSLHKDNTRHVGETCGRISPHQLYKNLWYMCN